MVCCLVQRSLLVGFCLLVVFGVRLVLGMYTYPGMALLNGVGWPSTISSRTSPVRSMSTGSFRFSAASASAASNCTLLIPVAQRGVCTHGYTWWPKLAALNQPIEDLCALPKLYWGPSRCIGEGQLWPHYS